MKSRTSKTVRELIFGAQWRRLVGISPCGCQPLLLECACHPDSCKCEAVVQVCRFEDCPGFVDVDFPIDERDRADAAAEEWRLANPAQCEQMLSHHDAWSQTDGDDYDARLTTLLHLLDWHSYEESPFDTNKSLFVSGISRAQRIEGMSERIDCLLSPFDFRRTVIDYKRAEKMTHNRNGRGATYTGEIKTIEKVLPPIVVGETFESIKAARIEHARRGS